MYEILRNLLKDQTGGAIFKCFGPEHCCFIGFFVIAAVMLCLYLKNKNRQTQKKTMDTLVAVVFALYMLDFFLMPFAYGEIKVDKLPFHVCTTMCIMCFWSRYSAFWGKFRLQFAMLGFLSNLTYLVYPAGMMWLNIHPMSYRVVQTLIFHGIMMVYGLLVLVYESEDFAWKKIYRDLVVVVAMTLWALFGNTLYNNSESFYNWFFVVQDPFEMFPLTVSPFIMPFLNVAIFFGVELVAYGILHFALYKNRKSASV